MTGSDNKSCIEVARDVTEVLALRDAWQKLAVDPNADIDFYLSIVQSRKEVLRPHVVVLRRGGIVRSILVGRVERKALEVGLGYRKVNLLPARFLTVIHGGLLGDDSEENVSALVGSIFKSLRVGEADVAWLYGLDADSAFHRVAGRMGGFLTRDHFPARIARWKVQLPATYEDLYGRLSGNTRHNLKRYAKRLREAAGNQVTVRSFRNPGDIEWVLSDTEAVAMKTYHRGLGVGFLHNNETRRIMTLAANRGWLRAYVLYLAGKPCAFWNGVLYKRTFFTWTTGYDPDFSDSRPGMFLLRIMIEDLCREKAADEVDFGFGDAQYKRDWCHDGWYQASLLLFAPTLKGVFLNLLRSPLLAASNAARSILVRTAALQRIKRGWRDRLARRRKTVPTAKNLSSTTAPAGEAAPREST